MLGTGARRCAWRRRRGGCRRTALNWATPAGVLELVDRHGSGPCARKSVEVRVLSPASFCRVGEPLADDDRTPGHRHGALTNDERVAASLRSAPVDPKHDAVPGDPDVADE